MQLQCSSALSEGAALPLTLSRRSHGMSAAGTLSGNCFSPVFLTSLFSMVPAAGIERYAPTHST